LKSRAYYQFGSLTLKKRAKSADVWEFRYYEDAAGGGRARKALFIGTTDMYKIAPPRPSSGTAQAGSPEPPGMFRW